MFNSAVGKIESCFDQNQAVEAIHLAAMYGKFGSIRYICSSFSIEIKQSDLFECSLFLGKSVNLFSSTYCLDSLFRMSEADPGLCPIRAIFSKTVFPARLDPTAQTYPFFKDYEKCFKTQERFLEC